MPHAVNMPQIGQDIETGRIVEWAVAENQPVTKGDVIVSVESDKAVFEVEAPVSGLLLKILKHDGEDAAVFSPIAYIGEPGQETVAGTTEQATDDAAAGRQDACGPSAGKMPALPGISRPAASPAARRRARERGIDLEDVHGSGPGGRIVARDLECAESEADIEIPFSPMRSRIAERLLLSKQSIPHFYVFKDVDCTALAAHRALLNEGRQERISWNDLIVRAVALSLEDFRRLNAHVKNDRLVLKREINIGVAVAVEDGLLVPVIEQANKKSVAEIQAASRQVVEGARAGLHKTARPGTFTISNLGTSGVDRFIPIINPPECAILGVGSIQKRVVAIEPGVFVREVLTVCLACDHRAVDGVYAAGFLNALKARLEDPERL
ncbi:MAG: 2-oxo acid dehydrogenase subunit E2 [Acidobacteria bacterium]|nr:MAG: 2-oxo acid dehydrogenase subunit E2 [Acidobacteriota bacterium]